MQNVWGEENVPDNTLSRKILDPLYRKNRALTPEGGGKRTVRGGVQNPFLGGVSFVRFSTPEPRSEVWWWNLRWSFGGKCFWRFSQQKKLENLLPNFAGSSPPISPKTSPTSLWKSLVLTISVFWPPFPAYARAFFPVVRHFFWRILTEQALYYKNLGLYYGLALALYLCSPGPALGLRVVAYLVMCVCMSARVRTCACMCGCTCARMRMCVCVCVFVCLFVCLMSFPLQKMIWAQWEQRLFLAFYPLWCWCRKSRREFRLNLVLREAQGY